MSIRPSPIAGRWYPGDAESLRQTIHNQYLNLPVEQPYPQVFGLVVPHAGMVYSGAVAGQAFRHIVGRTYDLVVLISPSHHAYLHPLLTSGHSAYQTPLGQVPIAESLRDRLQDHIKLVPVFKDQEHAIEIELPFLQLVLGDFKLLPLMMLDQSTTAAEALAHALVSVLAGQQVLYIASSDLSHFYDQATAQRLDAVILDAIHAKKPNAIIHADEQRQGFACGRGAIASVMHAIHAHYGAYDATIEAYATSGDVSGNLQEVVGYGAATFH